MLVQKATKNYEIHHDLNCYELALLELTSEGPQKFFRSGRKKGEFLEKIENEDGKQKYALTSKDIYYWAVPIVQIAQYESFREEELKTKISKFLEQHDSFSKFYREFNAEKSISAKQEDYVPQSLYQAIIQWLDVSKEHERVSLENVNNAYNSLIRKGLIKDPIDVPTVAAFGFLPYSWTVKTSQGQIVSSEVKALYWRYQSSRDTDGTTRHFELNVIKHANKLKKILFEVVERYFRDTETPDERENS